MKSLPNLTVLDEALDHHDKCAARIWGEIDRVIVSRTEDINEQLIALYRELDESVADVGRALHQTMNGRYSLKDCLWMCSGSRFGLNLRHGLISPVIREMVDDWRRRDRRFEPLEPRQPVTVAADGST